jgi:hypothetical protein
MAPSGKNNRGFQVHTNLILTRQKPLGEVDIALEVRIVDKNVQIRKEGRNPLQDTVALVSQQSCPKYNPQKK